MIKKIFTETLDADFWTSVIMELTGSPLRYPSATGYQNEKVDERVDIKVKVVQEDAEKIAADL